MNAITSFSISPWGNIAHVSHLIANPSHRDEIPVLLDRLLGRVNTVLPHGLARSYGDSCLNGGGGLLVSGRLDRCLAFDAEVGVLRAEAGLNFAQLHHITVPKGWFVRVTPGTKHVTLGGAVANDVHGKNHHVRGTFGHHVRRLALRRSDGQLLECSPNEEYDLFRATIGGLGLTGFIEWVEISLEPIISSEVEVENIRFDNVEAFFELSLESDGWPFTVSWIDCLSQGAALGRGIFMRGRWATGGARTAEVKPPRLAVPLTPPVSLVRPLSVKLFNEAYIRRSAAEFKGRAHFDPFFYPLDSVTNWNRVYGPRGFFQYQCVLPPDKARGGMRKILALIAASAEGSCLVVLKNFGDVPPAGMLSFPVAGTTLAMDFPNRGERTLRLFDGLDEIVLESGGRLYPAKDARMSPAMFHAGYPKLREFLRYRDPACSSDFQRRVQIC